MKILTRYVLREFLIPLCYCLVGFLSIYILFDFFGSFSRMREAELPISAAFLYFTAYLAPYFHYIVPAALMLATLYTMWNFCRHSEITAMRASGVSFLAIVKPLLAVSTLLAIAVAWVNESYVPNKANWAAQMKTYQFDRSRIERIGNVMYRNALVDRTWNIGEIADEDCKVLKNVHIAVSRPNGGARLMNITAPEVRYLDGEWWFYNAEVQHFNQLGSEVATPTPELDGMKLRSFPDFTEKPEDFLVQNRPWKFNSVRDRIRYLKTHPELSASMRRDYVYDLWALIMAPLACIIITLFAIPAGIASGRQSVFRGILSALALYFSFYGVTILFMVLAKSGFFPPIPAAVLPAVIFLGIGGVLFWRQR